LFPRKTSKKVKKGDSSAEEVKSARSGESTLKSIAANILPISNKFTVQEGKISDFTNEEHAYKKMRTARSDARLVGVRAKRAKDKAEADKDKKPA